MKKAKYLGIIIVLGTILYITGIATADSRKISNQEDVTINNAETELQNILNVEEKKLIYSGAISEKTPMYKNESGDLYIFGDNGRVTEYASNIDNVELREEKANETEVLSAAEKYLESLVEDPSYYQITHTNYDENLCVYSIIYAHTIGEYNTNDIVYLGIDNELNLIVFSIPRPYAFETIQYEKIHPETIQQNAINKFYQEFGNDCMDVTVKDLQLGTDDNENLGFQVYIEGYHMMDGEKIDEGDIIFIPYNE